MCEKCKNVCNCKNVHFSMEVDDKSFLPILEERLKKYNNIIEENSKRIFDITEKINNANMISILNAQYSIMFDERKNLISQNEIYMTKITEIEDILKELIDRIMENSDVSIQKM
jgi:hypothetical protein